MLFKADHSPRVATDCPLRMTCQCARVKEASRSGRRPVLAEAGATVQAALNRQPATRLLWGEIDSSLDDKVTVFSDSVSGNVNQLSAQAA